MQDAKPLLEAILRYDLNSFIVKTFQTVDPSCDYVPNWHVDVISHYLTQAHKNELSRIIINIPPRNLKSVCVSVAWPAWILGHNPAARILVSSYSQQLSAKHSLDCRLVMESPWYRSLFPRTVIHTGENEKNKFVTTERGFRLATSTGGSITGEGGDILIVDDPHNALEVHSDSKRQTTIDWFEQAFMSRLNHKQSGVVVVVMQRLHPDDLCGHLLRRPKHRWQQLCLPAIATREEYFQLPHRTYIRHKGQALSPIRENTTILQQIKADLGSFAFNAQYQQSPLHIESGMVKMHWFKRFAHAPEHAEIVQSWDTAIKTHKTSDFSVCTTWAATHNAYYLLDLYDRQMAYPDLKRSVKSLAQRWQPSAILIEDKASGQSLLQDLEQETTLPLINIIPTDDKVTRFSAVSAIIEAGKVFLPEHASWLAEFEQEISLFPKAAHDDRVDSFSQYLNWQRKKNTPSPRIRRL